MSYVNDKLDVYPTQEMDKYKNTSIFGHNSHDNTNRILHKLSPYLIPTGVGGIASPRVELSTVTPELQARMISDWINFPTAAIRGDIIFPRAAYLYPQFIV